MPQRLHCNFSGLKPGKTLGVAHFNRRLFETLAKGGKFAPEFFVERELLPAYANDVALGGPVRSLAEAKTAAPKDGAEYLASHFHERLFDLPLIVTAFDLHIFDIPWKYSPKGVRILGGRFVENIGRASAVLTMFPRTFRELGARFPAVRGSLFQIQSPTMLEMTPVSDAEREDVANRLGLRRDVPLLFYPSQLQAHKNHWNLLEAAARLVAEGLDFQLVCPGSDFAPEITRQILQRRDALGLTEHAIFPGYVSDRDIRVLLDLCTVLVAPSFAEGGANVIQEAIHAGSIGCCSDLESANLHLDAMGADVPRFDPTEPEEIATAIKECLTRRRELIERNRAARERIAGWNWETVAVRYEAVGHWIANGCVEGDRPSPEASSEWGWEVGPGAVSGTAVHHDEIEFSPADDASLNEAELVVALLAEGGESGDFFDVGAGTGASSRFAAKLGWRVHAFEPEASARCELSATLQAGAQVIVDPRAVGECGIDEQEFFVAPSDRGSSGLTPSTEAHVPAGKVASITLDDYCAGANVTEIAVLNVSVSGWELKVLRGFPWSRIRPRAIVCGFEDSRTMRLGHDFQKLGRLFEGLGYTVYVSEWHPSARPSDRRGWRCLRPFALGLRDGNAWGNLVAFQSPPSEIRLQAMAYKLIYHEMHSSMSARSRTADGLGARIGREISDWWKVRKGGRR